MLLGRLEEAAEQFREVIKLDPDKELAHRYLGRIYLKQGKEEEGRRELETADRLKRARR